MHSTGLALAELGALFFGLGVLGRLALRIGISPIPLYLLGGLAFGQGGVLEIGGGIEEFTALSSEIGVVLLLLLLGLEYSAAELITGLRRDWVAGIVDAVLNAAPGAAVAPGVHRREVGIAGVAVADEDPGELGQHTAGVDVIRAAAPDVHHGQVLGAGDVYVGQRPGGAAGGLIGMEHRRSRQQPA